MKDGEEEGRIVLHNGGEEEVVVGKLNARRSDTK
jgi:hypothetical protein